MSVKSILDDIAKAPLTVLKWLASPTGQTLVGIGETALEVAIPAATGVVNIFNKYVAEAVKVEALATAAGTAPGTVSTQKAAAVVNSIGPQIIADAQDAGMAAPTAAELLILNNLAVQFLNVFKPAPPATTVTAVKTP